MTEATPKPARRSYRGAALAGALALLFAGAVYAATGPTLGLFFGGVLVVTILLPPLVLCERSFVSQGLIASAVNDSVAVVWLVAVVQSQTTLGDWLRCYLLLASYVFALWGLVRALRSLRVPDVPAAAVTTGLAMLWLTWPVWLARGINDAIVAWLVPPHPLLSLNGVLAHLAVWGERPIAYGRLMNLGQDVAYQLPDGILSGVFVHVIAGGIFFAVASLRPDADRR